MLRIVVRDNGPGLSEEQKAKVFNAFYTTKTSGTGLGMAIVKRIIDAHGGTIEVGKDAPRGAEFQIALPVPQNPSAPEIGTALTQKAVCD